MTMGSMNPSGGGGKRMLEHSEHAPSPFLDYASLYLPTNLNEAFEIAELMYYSNRTFAQAIEYVVSYFVGTDIEIGGANDSLDEDKQQEYKKFLLEKMSLKSALFSIGRDVKVYGNSFISVLAPFKRMLQCPECGFAAPIEQVDYRFELKHGFRFRCQCGQEVKVLDPSDMPTREENRVHLKRWHVKQMRIVAHDYGGQPEYYYEVPTAEIGSISKSDRAYLESVPWGIVQSVRQGRMFKFSPGMVHHTSLGNLSDIKLGPWGLPPVIAGFRDAYLAQILKRNNECIALDHMLPIRLISPQSVGAGGDVMKGVNIGSFGQQVTRSIERARKDPTGWQWLPTPVNYQLLGGEGKNFVTPELLQNAQADFLNGLGIPVELYRKNLSAQTAPFAARLFEAGESIFLHGIQDVLSWIVDRVSAILSWLPCEARLVRPTHADDMERRMIMLQMMMQGVAAEQDVLNLFNLDWKDTYKKRQAEQEFKMKAEKAYMDRMQKAQENEQVLGAPPGAFIAAPGQAMAGEGVPGGPNLMMGGPGAPPAAAPQSMPQNGVAGPTAAGPSRDIDSFFADANARVQEIMATAPLGSPQRRQILDQIKSQDPNMHAVVKSMLDQATTQAEGQGRDQLRQPVPPPQ
jgi:hypothetical protein